MQRIKQLTEHYRQHRHPGVELGEAIMRHSQSPEYLVGVLSSFLKAAREDLETETRHCEWVIKHMRDEQASDRDET